MNGINGLYIKIFDPENPENVYVIPVNIDYFGVGDWDGDGNDEIFAVSGGNLERISYHMSLTKNEEDIVQFKEVSVIAENALLINTANMFSLNLEEYTTAMAASTSFAIGIFLKKSTYVNRVEMYTSANNVSSVTFQYIDGTSASLSPNYIQTPFGYYYIFGNPSPDKLVSSIAIELSGGGEGPLYGEDSLYVMYIFGLYIIPSTAVKLRNRYNEIVNPATEDTLSEINNKVATETTLQDIDSKVATEATLQDVSNKAEELTGALKSKDTDMFNVNFKSSEIMVPVDIQAQSPILVDESINEQQAAFISINEEYYVQSLTNNGYIKNSGLIKSYSYYDGNGIYDGDGIYDGL